MIHIVLVEPEIPQNTGNIVRTCVCTGTPLIIAGPMGFALSESRARRAGLDYWPLLDLTLYPDLDSLMEERANGEFWYFSSKADLPYGKARYGPDSYLVFGKETGGLDRAILAANPGRCVRIPMVADTAARCLNLSNSVCVGLYEALRQNSYPGLV